MIVDIVTQLMGKPRLLLAVVAIGAVVVWQREAALQQLKDRFEWVAMAVAGGYLGWAYYGHISTLLEVIPL